MEICCLDLEGVLIPEIWIAVAKKTGIPELRRTTRDEPNYDVLMRYRLKILKKRGIRLTQIQKVISWMEPLPGAKSFLKKLQSRYQVVILSDTFYEFAMPFMKKLDYPTLFCNKLILSSKGYVTGYRLRQANGKKKAVQALKSIGFRVVASGDSYNDLSMLRAAHRGVFFKPPASIVRENPRFRVTRNYKQLLKELGI